jgi:hypothetical protein
VLSISHGQSCEIGDEFHYVLQCPNFVTERKIIIPKILFNRPSALKLSSLFNKKKPETIRKLWVLRLDIFVAALINYRRQFTIKTKGSSFTDLMVK